MQITSVKSIGITVADMERSLDFYTTVLHCKKTSDSEIAGVECDRLYGLSNVRLRVVKLQLGNETIELTEFLMPKGRSIPPDSRSNDRWFQHMAIVVRDMEQAYQHLRHYEVPQTSPNPQTLPEWNPVAGGIQSFYFKDLDGHNLELIHFPVGKGDAKWQRLCLPESESLFLGIDHTAIVVANTAASRAFYCDRLGMTLQQESQNFGLEQERLSGVSGAHVQVSSLKASVGMGIELLEYKKPNHGLAIPTDTHANDLWFWQTAIVVEDCSPYNSLVQDPDGHTIHLIKQ
jgi:catechol 2,3-dioxygenase-like lactoylglutathione lyase family enzyme